MWLSQLGVSVNIHVLGQAVEVLLLLGKLLLELQELLLLTLSDSVVLIGLLASLESISRDGTISNQYLLQGGVN